MQYREFPAPAALAPLLRCIWVFQGEFKDPHDECIAPDGSPELIFHFGRPYAEADGQGGWRAQPRALLAGNLTGPLVLRAQGQVGVLGLRLWPHAVPRFTATPPKATLNARLPFTPADTRWAAQAAKALAVDSSAPAVLALAQRLVARLGGLPAREDAAVAWAVMELLATQGQAPLAQLAAAAGLSPRQFERRMAQATGMTPKLLASIFRFRAVFDQVNADQPSAWLNAALATGFFDQAHMIRDFRRFAGKAPRAYLQQAGVLSAALVAPR